MQRRKLNRAAACGAVAAIALATAAAPATAHDGKGHAAKSTSTLRCGCSALVSLDAAASVLGLTRAQLQAQLRAGSSLAQVAASAGKPLGEVAAGVTAAAKNDLDLAVAAGTLTPNQAQAIFLGVPGQVTALLAPAATGRARARIDGRCGLIWVDYFVVARFLRMTSSELWHELSIGKSLADLAAAAGKSLSDLVQASTDAATRNGDAAVAVAAVTAADAQAVVAGATQQVASVVGAPPGG